MRKEERKKERKKERQKRKKERKKRKTEKKEREERKEGQAPGCWSVSCGCVVSSVEDYTDGYMQALAMISHDSNVFWPPIVKFHSTCQIDITYFPFDDQVCGMKLGSWAYDGLQVRG